MPLSNVPEKLSNAIFFIENFLESERNMHQLFLTNKINKCTMPNKHAPMGKILKTNKRTRMFILHARVSS